MTEYEEPFARCLNGHDLDPVPFDEEAAQALLDGWEPSDGAAFILGNPMSAEVRKRWPRLSQKCKRCGETVICYASSAHFAMGDW